MCDHNVLCDDDSVCDWCDDDGTETLFFSTKSPTLPATLDTVPAAGACARIVHSVLDFVQFVQIGFCAIVC